MQKIFIVLLWIGSIAEVLSNSITCMTSSAFITHFTLAASLNFSGSVEPLFPHYQRCHLFLQLHNFYHSLILVVENGN